MRGHPVNMPDDPRKEGGSGFLALIRCRAGQPCMDDYCWESTTAAGTSSNYPRGPSLQCLLGQSLCLSPCSNSMLRAGAKTSTLPIGLT